ncbi:MAG: hypothetical protein JWN04_3234 [Myxococcaceae bacterium]|nr:hypothetical protein [Myxococcaceae bacterium]
MTVIRSPMRTCVSWLAVAIGSGCAEHHHTHPDDGSLTRDASATWSDAARPRDGSIDAGPPPNQGDAASYGCGAAECSESEICVVPTCGCFLGGGRNEDAGGCPENYMKSDAGDCVAAPCAADPPFCFRPDSTLDTYTCTGVNGTLLGLASAPIPDGILPICLQSCL